MDVLLVAFYLYVFIWRSAVPEERAMSVAIFLLLLCPLAVSNNNSFSCL